MSPPARAADLERWKNVLADLPKKIDVDKLSPDGRIDFDILRHDLERSIWLAENTHPFEEDPRTYNAYITDSVYSLLTQSTLPQERNIKNAVARMTQIPKVIAVAQSTLHDPPEAMTKTAISQNHGAIAFYKTGFFDLAGEAGRTDEAHTAAAKVVAALEDYQKFLEDDLLPKAKGDWRLGKEKFARKLDLELDAGLTADEVLQEAEKEFDRVERDMYVIARQLWAEAYPEQGAAARRRRRPARNHPSRSRSLQQGTRQAGRPDARRPRHRGPHQGVHRRPRHPAPARTRPL